MIPKYFLDAPNTDMTPHLAFLLVSLSIVYMHRLSPEQAVDYSLHCLTDYLFSINCSLSVTSNEALTFNHTYWLTFRHLQFYEELYNCNLAWNHRNYSCSFDTLPQNPQDDDDDSPTVFMDMDRFAITLYINRDGNISSRLLDEEFKPVEHIKPRTPCHLTVHWSSNQYNFTWESNYEDYPDLYLIENLMFELSYQRADHQDNAVTLSSAIMNIEVDDYHFEADVVYLVRVRSSPDQTSHRGQWSEWSSEVNWKTHSTHAPLRNTVGSVMDAKFMIPLCVLGPMLLCLCFVPVVKMRRNIFIPTPEPYFESLYSECKGDFKSWVVTSSNEGDIKPEETLKIDTILDKITLSPSSGPSCYSPATSASEAPLLGSPPAVNPREPWPFFSTLVRNASLDCTLERDSGCWRCSAASLEREVPLYTNEYCILSDTVRTAQKAGEAEDQQADSYFNERGRLPV